MESVLLLPQNHVHYVESVLRLLPLILLPLPICSPPWTIIRCTMSERASI